MQVTIMNGKAYFIAHEDIVNLCSCCLREFKEAVEGLDYTFLHVVNDRFGYAVYEAMNETVKKDSMEGFGICVMCHEMPTEYVALYKLKIVELGVVNG